MMFGTRKQCGVILFALWIGLGIWCAAEEPYTIPPSGEVLPKLGHGITCGVNVTEVVPGSMVEAVGMERNREYVLLVAGKRAANEKNSSYTVDNEVLRRLLDPNRIQPLHVVTARVSNANETLGLFSYLLPPGDPGFRVNGVGAVGIPGSGLRYVEISPDSFLTLAGKLTDDGDATKAMEFYNLIALWYPLSGQAVQAKEKRQQLQNAVAGNQIQTLLAQAENQSSQKAYDSAIALYERLLKDHPDYPEREQIIGRIGKLKEEKAAGEKEAKSSRFASLVNDGDRYMEQGLPEKAAQAYADALQIDATPQLQTKLELARKHQLENLEKARLAQKAEQEKLAEAEKEKRAHQKQEAEIGIQGQGDQVQAALQAGDLDKAEQILTGLQSTSPEHPVTLAMAALVQKAKVAKLKEGRTEKANEFSSAAKVLLENKEYAEALKLCDRALRIDKQNADALAIAAEIRAIPGIIPQITSYSAARCLFPEALEISDLKSDMRLAAGKTLCITQCRVMEVSGLGQAFLMPEKCPLPVIADYAGGDFDTYPCKVRDFVHLILKCDGLKTYETETGSRNALSGKVIWIGTSFR